MTDTPDKILVIDDSNSALKLLTSIFTQSGYAVLPANSGELALASLLTSRPDIILLDITMPVMDGFEVLRRLKENPETAAIPVVMISSATDTEKQLLGFQGGAVDFVFKPFVEEILLARIKTHLDLFRLQSNLKKKMAELEQVNKELAASEDQFRHVVMECPIPIAVSDRRNNIELFNNRFTATFGYSRNDIPTLDVWLQRAYPDPEYRTVVRDLWRTALEKARHSGDIVNFSEEFRITCKNGMVRIAQITATPISSGLLVAFNDVTARREAEQELKQIQTQAIQQEKLATLGLLAAGVAHEINNPMGFITSNLGALGKYLARIREYLAIIEAGNADANAAARSRLKIDHTLADAGNLIAENLDGALRVKNIVGDLKLLSRSDRKEPVRADLNKLLERSLNIVANELKYVADIQCEYGDIPEILCYPQQLSQVFINLLTNAGQSLREHGAITIRTWSEQGQVCIAIADTGAGISADTLSKIFEPFFTTKEVGKGTGLGLSISREIILKHDGRIEVKSEPERGATFTVRIPIEPNT